MSPLRPQAGQSRGSHAGCPTRGYLPPCPALISPPGPAPRLCPPCHPTGLNAEKPKTMPSLLPWARGVGLFNGDAASSDFPGTCYSSQQLWPPRLTAQKPRAPMGACPWVAQPQMFMGRASSTHVLRGQRPLPGRRPGRSGPCLLHAACLPPAFPSSPCALWLWACSFFFPFFFSFFFFGGKHGSGCALAQLRAPVTLIVISIQADKKTLAGERDEARCQQVTPPRGGLPSAFKAPPLRAPGEAAEDNAALQGLAPAGTCFSPFLPLIRGNTFMRPPRHFPPAGSISCKDCQG